jgi:hypothetical protein
MKFTVNPAIYQMGQCGIPFVADDKNPGTIGYAFTYNVLPGSKTEPQFLFRNIPVEQYDDIGDLLRWIKFLDFKEVYHT